MGQLPAVRRFSVMLSSAAHTNELVFPFDLWRRVLTNYSASVPLKAV
jgi:hypothetical protein